jgi:segregation and condensation protein A
MLLQKQQIEEAVLTNPALKQFRNAEGTEPELAADVIDLVRVFREVLERAKNKPVFPIDEDSVSIAQMIQYLRRRLLFEEGPVRLKQILRALPSQNALICAFLAVLELVRVQAVQLRQERLFGDILIRKHVNFDGITGEEGAVRDDWR